MIPSEKIFGAFDSKRILSKIATQRCLNVADESKDQIVKLISEDIRDVGFSRMLLAIKLNELKAMGEIVRSKKKETDRIPAIKRVLQKKIKDYCDEVGQDTFWDSVPSSVKKDIIKTLDIEMPDSSSEYTQSILSESEAIGQDYFFSSFTPEKLAKFALSCGLDVDSLSQNVLIDCLMNLQNYKAPKKKPAPKPSRKKPEKIAKGITKIDLSSHYTKDELVEFCKAEKLPYSGNKRDLITKILAHVEGRPIPLSKGKKRRKKKSSSSKKDDDKKTKRGRENSSGESPKKKKRASTEKKSESESSSSTGEVDETLKKTPKKK